jgi:ubiquinone/menaquinone biosynthesis C-methylase UbiE
MIESAQKRLVATLLKIYARADEPLPWDTGSDFPWDDPEFGRRTLAEHLDENHGAASRSSRERQMQIDWLWHKLALEPGQHVVDITCGPGLYAVELARRGCIVTGIDINPAAIEYATELASRQGVADRCTFIRQDVRDMADYQAQFDAALFLYEQLAVYSTPEAQLLLEKVARSLKPGGRVAVELLNQDNVDKTDSSWWFTDDSGLWGDSPFLHLGERMWDDELQASLERYHIIHLESGQLKQYTLFDQTYAVSNMAAMMQQTGFSHVEHYLNWAGLPLYDAGEWVVYVAQKSG